MTELVYNLNITTQQQINQQKIAFDIALVNQSNITTLALLQLNEFIDFNGNVLSMRISSKVEELNTTINTKLVTLQRDNEIALYNAINDIDVIRIKTIQEQALNVTTNITSAIYLIRSELQQQEVELLNALSISDEKHKAESIFMDLAFQSTIQSHVM